MNLDRKLRWQVEGPYSGSVYAIVTITKYLQVLKHSDTLQPLNLNLYIATFKCLMVLETWL